MVKNIPVKISDIFFTILIILWGFVYKIYFVQYILQINMIFKSYLLSI